MKKVLEYFIDIQIDKKDQEVRMKRKLLNSQKLKNMEGFWLIMNMNLHEGEQMFFGHSC